MPCSAPHRVEPGRIEKSRIEAISSGVIAEVVVDDDQDSWARWFSGDRWTSWRHVEHHTGDIAVTGPYGPGGSAALVSVTAWRPDGQVGLSSYGRYGHVPPQTRFFYLLGPNGITPAGL